MSFLKEIKRRKVFQVAVAYAVVAWLLVQVITAVEAPLNLPDWFDTTVIVLLALGFPVAVILAWAFDLTPQGISATSEAAADATVLPAALRFGYISQALILLAVSFLVVDQYVLESRDDAGTQPSTLLDNSSGLTRRYSIILDSAEMEAGPTLSAEIALSPDGRHLAYSAQGNGHRQLYLRDLEQGATQALAETEGARGPSFSSDGEWIVFRSNQRLLRVSVRGGTPRVLSDFDARTSTGISSTPDDSILFAAANSANVVRLHRIAALGGTPEPLDMDPDGFGYTHNWPDVLPGGSHVLYTISPIGDASAQERQIAVHTLETGESRTLIEDAYNGRYVPTGHIVFMRSATLWAVPFDVERLELTGPEVPVVNGVTTNSSTGVSAYTFSDEGLLAYLPGGDTTVSIRNLVWVDRQGGVELIPAEPNTYRHPRLSPDQRRVAVSVRERGNEDVWIIDLASGLPSRLTLDPAVDHSPLWSPDGKFIVFHSERDGGGIFRKAADGVGQVERLTTGNLRQYPETFSPDGEHLVFRQDDQSLYVLSMSGPMDFRPLIANAYQEHFAAISPDGRWIAYESHENGFGEIYVRPFPEVEDGGPWQVSRNGGAEPRWTPHGEQIIYSVGGGEGGMVAVQVETEPSFFVLVVDPLPDIDLVRGALNEKPNYDISADGERLIGMRNAERAGNVANQPVLTVVDNWFEELKRLAPSSDTE